MRNFLNGSEKIIATSKNYLKSSLVLKKYYSKVDVIPCGLTDDINCFKINKSNKEIIKKKIWRKIFFLCW